MKKILIIGKNSYIGKQLEEYLAKWNQSEEKYIVVKISASNGEWKTADYTGYDVVVLLSGMVHKREKDYGYDAYYKVNYEMAVEIAQKAKKAGVRQLIFASTMAVFGDNATVISENTQPMPTTFYGKTKLLAEDSILSMEQEDFAVAVIRPPMVYGRECKGNFIRLAGMIRKLFFFPKVKNQRSMIHITNLCEFIRLLIEKEVSGKYHPQNKEYVTTSRMVSTMAKYQNHRIWIVPGFGWMIQWLMKYVPSLKKMFGDCYYTKEMSSYQDMNYWITNEEESIKKSI